MLISTRYYSFADYENIQTKQKFYLSFKLKGDSMFSILSMTSSLHNTE